MLSGDIKILVIDDEEDFSYFTKRNLERLDNYSVITAKDGKSGLEAARQEKPDLILLDVMMPGIDGFEVLEILKKDETTLDIPVVMLTGVEDEDARAKAASLKNEDYIVKPVGIDELRHRVEKALANHKDKGS